MNPHDDDRRVEDFFAAQRDRVVEHQADDETWEAIRLRAAETRSRSRGMWFLGGAVAASAAAVGTVLALGMNGPGSVPAPPAGAERTSVDAPTATDGGPGDEDSTEEPTGTGERSPEPSDDATPPPGPVPPETFPLAAPDGSVDVELVLEPSGDESDLRVAQFDYACDAAQMEWHCPGLAVSEDAGQTWQMRVDMAQEGFYSAVAARQSIWMWGPEGETRPGLPAGAARLVRSDDAGRSWLDVPTRGTPIGVETFRSTLVVVTSGCDGGTPETCAEVVVTDVTADDATTGRRTATLRDLPRAGTDFVVGPGWTPRAGLSATYDAVYVTYGDATYRIADGEQVATLVEPPTPGCPLTSAPESADSLVSWCVGADVVSISADGGLTWEEVEGVRGASVVDVASNDGVHLVLATDDGIHVGSGGDDWTPTLPWDGGPTLLDALGGDRVRVGGPYRFAPDGDEALSDRWTSEDGGRTWTQEPRIVLP